MADKKSDASSCGSYPAPGCSASECLAASKFLRELLAEQDIEEAQKPAWWRMFSFVGQKWR